jgi:hypothetical protein
MKFYYYLGVFIGSTIGGFIPMLWGADLYSFSPILFSGIGGIIGIVVVYQLNNR